MSARIPVPGLEHGDKVRLTGEGWKLGSFNPDDVYEVDNRSFHRPVIYADSGTGKVVEWYIVSGYGRSEDFSVTKVEA